MRKMRIPQSIDHMDLAILYGIKPAKHRWDDDRLENVVCIIGCIVFWAVMVIMVGLWFEGAF